MLDFRGFLDFSTVVHEHFVGLRSWHRRAERTGEGPAAEKGKSDTAKTGHVTGAALSGLQRQGDGPEGARGAPEPSARCGGRARKDDGTHPGEVSRARADGGDDSRDGESEIGGALAEHGGGSPTVAKPPRAVDGSGLGETDGFPPPESPASPTPSGGRKEHLHAAPWLSWDTRLEGSSAACDPPTFGPPGGRDGVARAVEGGRSGSEEEPAVNRAYGKGTDREPFSANALVAFQTDRVVRVLDRLF